MDTSKDILIETIEKLSNRIDIQQLQSFALQKHNIEVSESEKSNIASINELKELLRKANIEIKSMEAIITTNNNDIEQYEDKLKAMKFGIDNFREAYTVERLNVADLENKLRVLKD